MSRPSCRPPSKTSSRLLKRPICFVGALGRTLNVQRVRLACGRRAPPRIWTFLSSLQFDQHLLQALDACAGEEIVERPLVAAQAGHDETDGENDRREIGGEVPACRLAERQWAS